MAIGLGDVLANLIGYMLGSMISFPLNSKWPLRRVWLGHVEFVGFLLVIAGAYLINLAVMLSLCYALRWSRVQWLVMSG